MTGVTWITGKWDSSTIIQFSGLDLSFALSCYDFDANGKVHHKHPNTNYNAYIILQTHAHTAHHQCTARRAHTHTHCTRRTSHSLQVRFWGQLDVMVPARAGDVNGFNRFCPFVPLLCKAAIENDIGVSLWSREASDLRKTIPELVWTFSKAVLLTKDEELKESALATHWGVVDSLCELVRVKVPYRRADAEALGSSLKSVYDAGFYIEKLSKPVNEELDDEVSLNCNLVWNELVQTDDWEELMGRGQPSNSGSQPAKRKRT